MQQFTKLITPAALVIGLITASASLAQTCNPNIPLRTPDSEFTDHGDGTITHHTTGLIWIKCREGQSGADCTGTPTFMTWGQALVHASSREFAGYADWRLPNIKELASIVEDACYYPAINLSVFPDDSSAYVWSSSPYASNPGYAWLLSFGRAVDAITNKPGGNYVRLVRGGQ